jgi:hypothetical protein
MRWSIALLLVGIHISSCCLNAKVKCSIARPNILSLGGPMTGLDPDLLNTCSSSALGFFNGASIVVLTTYVLR